MMTIARSLAVDGLLGAWLLFPADGLAQTADADRPRPPDIRVSAEAVIPVDPDRVEIDVGVVTEARTAQAAGAQNGQRLEAVIAALRRLLGPEARIKTISYALNPIHTRPKPDGRPAIAGYTAANTVRVTTDELTLAGRIVDTAMDSGANTIDRLTFTLKDERPALARALGQAAVQAREKADAIAAALGVKIVRVLRAEESGVALRSFETYAPMERAATPIEPGAIDVRATVTLTVEIAN
jgi:uncharacterized protein YggE